MKAYSFPLDELAARLRGLPIAVPQVNANVYFVITEGHVIVATTVFNVANNLFENLVGGKHSAVLADRRSGDVATYYPAKGMVIDLRMDDYYQQQKFGLTDEQMAEAISERDEA